VLQHACARAAAGQRNAATADTLCSDVGLFGIATGVEMAERLLLQLVACAQDAPPRDSLMAELQSLASGCEECLRGCAVARSSWPSPQI